MIIYLDFKREIVCSIGKFNEFFFSILHLTMYDY